MALSAETTKPYARGVHPQAPLSASSQPLDIMSNLREFRKSIGTPSTSSRSTTSSHISSGSADIGESSHSVRSSVMGFLTRKKDLERTRLEKERLERELEENAKVHAMELANMRDREKKRLAEERYKKSREDRVIQDAKDKRNAKLKKMKESSPETLRDLRELIRNRYQMDVEIWGLRSARKPDRPKVLEKMVVADAIMEEIWMTVGTWENQRDGNWTDDEWDRVQEIKARLQSDGKRVWEGNPPWADAGNAGRRVSSGRAERW